MRWTDRLARLLLRDALPPEQPLHLIHFGDIPGVNPYGLTEASALGLSAVYRCIQIIAGGVAILPWAEWRGNLELPPSRIVDRPMETLTRREWVWRVVSTLALHNVGHIQLVGGLDKEGVPLSLVPIPPNQVQPITRTALDSQLWQAPVLEYQVGNRRVPADEIAVIRRASWPTVNDRLAGLLELARITLGGALAAEGYASRYWQAGGAPVTVLTTEAELTGNQADEIADRWRDRRAKGPDYPAVLGKGAKANPYGADPTTESAVEARRELVADVGRYFGIPTILLNAPSGDPQTYRTTESEGLALVRYTLADYMAAIEDLVSDLLPGARAMRMNPAVLTRGEQLTRYQAWESALRAGWMDADEVRAAEGMPPRELGVESQPATETLARALE